MTTGIALDRIRFFVGRLSDAKMARSQRMECWRLIISAARDAHEAEVREQDELNSVVADPIITEAAGGIVG